MPSTHGTDASLYTTGKKFGCWRVASNLEAAELQPGAKTINVFRACLGAQLTICAQK